jgi:hypothetical protein
MEGNPADEDRPIPNEGKVVPSPNRGIVDDIEWVVLGDSLPSGTSRAPSTEAV